MEVTIDKFGRILIPKKVRQALNLQMGQSLTLTINADKESVSIRPLATPSLTRIKTTPLGLPIISRSLSTHQVSMPDMVSFIKESREQYLDRKMGSS